MNISCKFEKASYNIFFVRAVTVKSFYTLRRRRWRRRRRNKVKSIVSTGCYPVDTINQSIQMRALTTVKYQKSIVKYLLWSCERFFTNTTFAVKADFCHQKIMLKQGLMLFIAISD